MIPGRRLQTEQTKPSPVIEPRAFRSLAGGQAPPLILGQARGEVLRRVRAKIAHHQSLVAANGEDIRLVVAFQHDAQRLVAAVNRVAQHPGAGNAGLERRRHHGDADLGLGGERHVVGNARRLPALRVFDPVLWQIETAVDQSVSSSGSRSRGRRRSDSSRSARPCRCIGARRRPNGGPSSRIRSHPEPGRRTDRRGVRSRNRGRYLAPSPDPTASGQATPASARAQGRQRFPPIASRSCARRRQSFLPEEDPPVVAVPRAGTIAPTRSFNVPSSSNHGSATPDQSETAIRPSVAIHARRIRNTAHNYNCSTRRRTARLLTATTAPVRTPCIARIPKSCA